MRQSRGLWIALAALAVSAPRLSLAFLQADGVRLPAMVEAGLVGLTGVATAIVLTGGNMYLAHSIADERVRGGWYKIALGVAWIAELLFSLALIAPSLVNALRASGMDGVLATSGAQWLWAIAAVLAVETLAAAAMVADAAHRSRPASASGPSALGKLAAVAVASLERRVSVAASVPAVPQASLQSEQASLPTFAPSLAAFGASLPSLAPSLPSVPSVAPASASVAPTAERLLPCPNAARGCTWTGRPAQVGPHVQHRCAFKETH